MMKHKRLLVPLSLSDGRDLAFDRALAMAKAWSAKLYLLHAVPAYERFSYRATERLQRSKELRERAEAAGVSAQTVEQHGDPAEIIVLHADARAVDLIVIGTERRTGWARWRQRSVAESVLRRTKRPTLVVGSRDAADKSTFENVLVAVDLSPASTALIDTALQLPGAEGRQLTVIHTVHGIEAASGVGNRAWMVPEYRGHLLDAARGRLADVMPSSGATDVKLHVAGGPVAQTICAYAADCEADLIVMGRSKRFMHLGSTAVRVLRTTDRALLIVPPSAYAQTIGAERSVHKRAA
jgi:nucleotide-binding universal stress UspA family protein